VIVVGGGGKEQHVVMADHLFDGPFDFALLLCKRNMQTISTFLSVSHPMAFNPI
jgi:hypothetical protein